MWMKLCEQNKNTLHSKPWVSRVVCAWVFWVHECVGAVGQILAWMMRAHKIFMWVKILVWVAWVTYVHKILAWVEKLASVKNNILYVLFLFIILCS